MGAGLFMAHQDVFDPAFAFSDVKRVVDRENRSAGVTKNGVDTMSTQSIHESRCAADANGLPRRRSTDGRRSGDECHGSTEELTLQVKGRSCVALQCSPSLPCGFRAGQGSAMDLGH